MSSQSESLWTTLHKSGLVQGAAPEAGELESPWYVKVLLAFSGWLAALLLLGFIGMGFQSILRNSTAALFVGAMMIAGAYAVLRLPKNEFVEHLALAASLAGQALVAFAIFRLLKVNDTMAWVWIAILQILLAIVMPNFVHRVFSSFIAAFSFFMALSFVGAAYVFTAVLMFFIAWLWLNEFKYPQHMRKIHAIGYGLVLALIQFKGTMLFSRMFMGWRYRPDQPELWVQPWMSEALAGAVMLYVVWQLLRRHGHAISDRLSILALLSTVLLCIISMEAQGITAGLMIMLLGFSAGNRVLLGLGIASLLFYISSYYYLLDATLLTKAMTLLLVGVVLLFSRWLMLRFIPANKEVQHG